MHGTAMRFSCQSHIRQFVRARRLIRGGLLAFMVMFAWSCQQKPTQTLDSSQFVVTPGLGISNRYQVGMTFARIRESFPDAMARRAVRGKYSKSMLVPSLGAMSYLGNDMPVSHIDFFLEPHQLALYPDLEIRTPFRGRLGNEFHFGEQSVSGQDVEAVYGPILKRVLVAGDGLRLLQQADPFSRSNRVNEETWYYPARGLAFDLKSNRVTSFQVFRPTATNTSNAIPRTK